MEKEVNRIAEYLQSSVIEDHANALKEKTEEKLKKMKERLTQQIVGLEVRKRTSEVDEDLYTGLLNGAPIHEHNEALQENKRECESRMDHLVMAIEKARASLIDAEKVMNDWNESRSIGRVKDYVISDMEKQIEEDKLRAEVYRSEMKKIKKSVDTSVRWLHDYDSRQTSRRTSLQEKEDEDEDEDEFLSACSEMLAQQTAEQQSLQEHYKSSCESSKDSLERKQSILLKIKDDNNMITYELQKTIMGELQNTISDKKSVISDLETELRKIKAIRRLQSRASINLLTFGKRKDDTLETGSRITNLMEKLTLPSDPTDLLSTVEDAEEEGEKSESEVTYDLQKQLEEKKTRYNSLKSNIQSVTNRISEMTGMLYELLHNEDVESVREKIVTAKTRHRDEIQQRVDDLKSEIECVRDDEILLNTLLDDDVLGALENLKINDLKKKLKYTRPKLKNLKSDLDHQKGLMVQSDHELSEWLKVDTTSVNKEKLAKKLRTQIINTKEEFGSLEFNLEKVSIELAEDEKAYERWLNQSNKSKGKKTFLSILKEHIENKKVLKNSIMDAIAKAKKNLIQVETTLWGCEHIDYLREQDLKRFSLHDHLSKSVVSEGSGESRNISDHVAESLETIKKRLSQISELKLQKTIITRIGEEQKDSKNAISDDEGERSDGSFSRKLNNLFSFVLFCRNTFHGL